jgi:hypothetical protein
MGHPGIDYANPFFADLSRFIGSMIAFVRIR